MCGFPVHDLVAQRKESFGGQRFSEEISKILIGLDIRHDEFTVFHHLPDKEMSPIDMFSPGVMFRVIGKITSSLVIHEELNSITFEGFKFAGTKRFK